MRESWFALLLILVADGCTTDQRMTEPDHSSDVRSAVPAASAVPRELMDRVKADAARVTGRREEEISVVSAESVTWSDASLGCPAPGMMHAQVLTPGYRIVLRAGDRVLDYHAGRSQKFILCPQDRARPPMRQSPDV